MHSHLRLPCYCTESLQKYFEHINQACQESFICSILPTVSSTLSGEGAVETMQLLPFTMNLTSLTLDGFDRVVPGLHSVVPQLHKLRRPEVSTKITPVEAVQVLLYEATRASALTHTFVSLCCSLRCTHCACFLKASGCCPLSALQVSLQWSTNLPCSSSSSSSSSLLIRE